MLNIGHITPVMYYDPSGNSVIALFLGIGGANLWNPVGWIMLAIAVVVCVVVIAYVASEANSGLGNWEPGQGVTMVSNESLIDTNVLNIVNFEQFALLAQNPDPYARSGQKNKEEN